MVFFPGFVGFERLRLRLGSVSGHRPWQLVWPLALWLVVVGNLPLWQRVSALGGSQGLPWLWLGSLGLLVWGGTMALLSLLVWPGVYRLAATLLVLVTALNTHFMWQYGAVIDPTMLASVLQTDAREVRDLLSPQLLLTVLLVAGVPLWWIWREPLRTRHWLAQSGRNAGALALGLLVAVLVTLLTYPSMASLIRNHKNLRYMINPLNSVYAATRLAADQLPKTVHNLQTVGEDAQLGARYVQQARPPLLVLVVGETARAQNWGLSGYARPTTPALVRWQAQGHLVNYSQVQSCGTNTQVSVPCMFSPLTRAQGGDTTAVHESLLDVLQRAGLAVLWLDNQSGCKGACARVPHVGTSEWHIPGLCADGECFDEAMLLRLDERIAALDPLRRARGVVLVLHEMGSHGPAYFKRTPASHKPFMPECTSNTLSDCAADELVNAYDNTIAYTDHFLDQTLSWLQQRAAAGTNDTGLIYLSDHGESLGENGLYLHGVPYAFAPQQQTHVPMVTWLSPGLQQRTGVHPDCLRRRAGQTLSHDNLFHSVLGLMNVRTQVYQPALDLFEPCTAPQSPVGFKPPAQAS